MNDEQERHAMSMKSWVLHRVHGIGSAAGRADLAPRGASRGREPDLRADTERHDGAGAPAEPLLVDADSLGAYAPLIGALRDELEHFVAGQVRLHVVIADRDRFVLTALGVRATDGAAARELLQQFMREFRPEQVKRYLAREVIGRLPNAAVIDLTQFAGLADIDAAERADDSEYAELLAALRTAPPAARRAYEVSVLGRWTEADSASPAHTGRAPAAVPRTPLAVGRRCEFEIDDGTPRRAVLHSVVAGRRYVIGKDEASDLRVDGTYTSRRHAELWLDDDGWQVADAGSTNGIRVEPGGSPGSDEASAAAVSTGEAGPLRLAEGMCLVLSARAAGPSSDYPTIVLRTPVAPRAAPRTPIAAAPKTPLTVVRAVGAPRVGFVVAVSQAGGERSVELTRAALPFTIGRSRDQSLVVDRQHAGVSGRHVAIDALDEDGARGVIVGDNGVAIDGVGYAAGASFAWRPGQTMVLGGALPGEPGCALALVAASGD
jgi:pSer/pThr/pTyr-binding forkhead associated (FHA) protein